MTERKDLDAIELAVLGETLQKELEDFKVSLKDKLIVDELVVMEDELMAKMKEYDKYLNEVKYKMSGGVVFEGRKYALGTISNYIVEFLNKTEVDFQMSLGMHQLVELWKTEPTSLEYHKYDSTLRCLGTLKFKGDDEWTKILAVNEFMLESRESYSRDTTYLIFISQIHSALLDRMQELNASADGAEVESESV